MRERERERERERDKERIRFELCFVRKYQEEFCFVDFTLRKREREKIKRGRERMTVLIEAKKGENCSWYKKRKKQRKNFQREKKRIRILSHCRWQRAWNDQFSIQQTGAFSIFSSSLSSLHTHLFLLVLF